MGGTGRCESPLQRIRGGVEDVRTGADPEAKRRWDSTTEKGWARQDEEYSGVPSDVCTVRAVVRLAGDRAEGAESMGGTG